jgi:hypothetical protein
MTDLERFRQAFMRARVSFSTESGEMRVEDRRWDSVAQRWTERVFADCVILIVRTDFTSPENKVSGEVVMTFRADDGSLVCLSAGDPF